MKFSIQSFIAALLAIAAVPFSIGQQQPVLTVGITGVSVLENDSDAIAFIGVTAGGSGYTSAPRVTIGGDGSGAVATAIISPITGAVTQIIVEESGGGYTSAPSITIEAPPLAPAGQPANLQATGRAYLGKSFPQPSQNESYGETEVPIAITASAVGTFPAGGFTYTFFVNGVSIGVTEPLPAGIPATVAWTPPQPGSYFLTVSVTDGSNNATSLPIRYFATGTIVNSPVSNTIVPAGSSVVLKADATVAQGFIRQIQFYDNGNPIGAADTTIPYSLIYIPAPHEPHLITAQATDNDGNLVPVSDPIRLNVVTAISPLPTSVISSPANNAVIPIPTDEDTDVSIAVDAASTSGSISKVELYVDGVLLETKTAYPYVFDWHPTLVGPYNLVALVYDDKNNVVASTAGGGTNTPAPTRVLVASLPNVTLVTPKDNDSVGQPAQLSADVTDSNPGGTITLVEFFQDGELVATGERNTGTNTYSASATLRAKRDEDGNTVPSTIVARATVTIVRDNKQSRISGTSPEVTVDITNGAGGGGNGEEIDGEAPTVAMTSPGNGIALPVGRPVQFAASATDSDGIVGGVEFLVNGEPLGEADTAYPYSASWTPTNLGVYSIVARATDDDGLTETSSTITVRVIDPAVDSEAVYSGYYVGSAETGTFAAIRLPDGRATFIATSSTGEPKNYFFTNIPAQGGKAFEVRDDAGAVLLSGTFGDSGVSGTLPGASFVGALDVSTDTTSDAGFYSGSVTGRGASAVTGILTASGQLTLHVADGSFSDVGSGMVDGSGAFSITTRAGNKFTGKVDPATGFVSGNLTGTASGAFTAGLASGSVYSDGILRGLSTRGFVSTGDNILIAGFVVEGSAPKQLLMRGVGPSLGIANSLPNPRLGLYSGSTLVAANDNWATPIGDGSSAEAIVAATAHVGLGALNAASNDAVILRTVNPGIYTAQLGDAGGATGNALLEVYDLSTPTPFTGEKVYAISTRGYVNGNGNELIAGFIITGSSPKKVLVQAVGPTLPGEGKLSDPVLQIVQMKSGSQTLVRENNDWSVGNDATLVAAAAASSGANALGEGSKDAAILITLPPGIYTAVVSGASGASGIALVNVYEVR